VAHIGGPGKRLQEDVKMKPESTPPEQPVEQPEERPSKPRGRHRPPRGKDPFAAKRGVGYGPGHYKIETRLTPEHLQEYYALIRQHRTTYDSARRWLHERGYTDIGLTAIRRHMGRFRNRLDSVRQAAEMSMTCGELARQLGPSGNPVLAEGAVTRFETLLSQALFDLDAGGKLGREEWDMLGKALTNAVSNRTKLEELRRAFEDAKRHAAEAAEAAANEGADGMTVVDRVKEILGV
jgi:hypothetical protein